MCCTENEGWRPYLMKGGTLHMCSLPRHRPDCLLLYSPTSGNSRGIDIEECLHLQEDIGVRHVIDSLNVATLMMVR